MRESRDRTILDTAIPLADFAVSSGQGSLSLAAWQRLPLSQEEKSTATLEQERNENRDPGHWVCFYWLWLLGAVYQ